MALKSITKDLIEQEKRSTGCGVFEAQARIKRRHIVEEIEELRSSIAINGSEHERRLLDLIEAISTKDGPRG